MVYQGSKNRLTKYIVPIIQKQIDENNITTYIEPFVGGANVIDKISCENRIGSDINEELIALLKYIQEDNNISIAPSECSFEHYAEVREARKLKTEKFSKEYTALIRFCASYGGRYFDGGYGRDAKGGRSIYAERLKNLKEQAPHLDGIEFKSGDYRQYESTKSALFYMDPPYKGTKQYSTKFINYDEFYDFCRNLSKNNIVLISEYNMPPDFKCIWEKERTVKQDANKKGMKATEKLFMV